MIIMLRLIHILLGAFWAGTLIFLALFLEPSVRSAGPAGGSVMVQLLKRNFSQIIGAVGAFTILSGLGLFWIDSSGFRSLWIQTPAARGYSVGALTAIIALVIGLTIVRPTARRLVELAGTDPQSAEMPALRRRMMIFGRWIASLLTVTVIAMAVARYL